MTPRHYYLVSLFLISLLRAYGQATAPGCTTPYYRNNFAPPLDGYTSLQSLAEGPDASIYIGSDYGNVYSIIKLDSFGNTIRNTSYTPVNANNYNAPGKTIVDVDGNLFSVIFNNYILRTDTIGNILSARKLDLPSGVNYNFLDIGVLANGDKALTFVTLFGGYQADFLVVTNPDASVIKWTKYFYAYTYTSNFSNTSLLADGNKIILGIDFSGSSYYPNGSGIFELDAGTGAVLQQGWFPQTLSFRHISRYNNGYIFSGITDVSNSCSFYVRTDTNLNVISANDFPAYGNSYPFSFPFLFQAQADGSVYGYFSASSTMILFLISPGDVIQWASGIFGFYQDPISMALNPSGIFIGTDYSATDVGTGGPLSGIEVYKAGYSGYFPPCTNPVPATMTMAAYPLTQGNPLAAMRDTSAFSNSNYIIQTGTPPTSLVSQICTGTPTCNNIRITGNPSVCSGSGTFTGNLNGGCSLPITWSVTGGPGTATINQLNNNAVSISFSQDGAYMVKALANTNCTNFGDSVLVHVSTGAQLTLGDDTLLCAGNSLILHAGSNFSSYAWQDGSTDSTFLVTTPGQFTVTVTDFCGNSFSSTVNVSFLPPLTSPFPANITKCQGDTADLALPSGFDSVYFLSPPVNARLRNDSVQFYNSGPANYSLEEIDVHGCTVKSPVSVQVYPQPVLNIGSDSTICPDDSLRLDAGAAFSSYQWSTGSQNQTIWALTKGTYWVQTVTANGCILRDSMVLANYPAPVVDLDPDTVLCTGASRQLSAGDGFASYLWNDGSTSSTLTVSATGQYWVKVTDDQGCYTADTVTIEAIVPLPADFLPADTTICQFGSLTLIPKGEFSSYLWSDGSTASSILAQTPGLYYLQVVDKNGCTGRDSILLTGKQCLIGFYIPNAFTPNNDGKNDVFRPLIYGNVVNYKFAVYNRWGQQVFVSADLMKGWDGTVGGAPQPAGGFVWYCVYQLQGQNVQIEKGTVLLVR
jgi:gliding motility-associated-like protein